MIQLSNEVKAVKAVRGKRWEQTKCVWRHDVEEDMEVDKGQDMEVDEVDDEANQDEPNLPLKGAGGSPPIFPT